MSKYENLKMLGIIALIPLTIFASNHLKPTLAQRVQDIIIATPDATAVDAPKYTSQIDSNYFKAPEDFSYLLQ